MYYKLNYILFFIDFKVAIWYNYIGDNMYKFRVDISEKEYNKFVSVFSMAPITQDYRWASVKNDWNHTLCALYKDDKIVAASLLLIKTFPMGLKMIYSPKGFLIDYTNKKYLEEFTKGIKEYAKKIKAFVVKIDPLIAVNEDYYDTFVGKSDKVSPKNYSKDKDIKISNLKSCGYIHGGYKKNVGAYIQPRFNMAISLIDKDNKALTEKELLSNFKRNAKRYHGEFQTKRGVSFICVHDNSYIDDFYRIIKSTEDRQGISLRSKDYFKRIMSSFKEDAYMYIARVDVNKFESFLKHEIEHEKDENLVTKYKSQLEDAKIAKEKYGNEISIAATLAIIPPNKKGIKKVEYLYAGTFEEVFPYLNTNASVHINSFIDMLNMGYDYADLEGVDGTLDDHLTKTKAKYNPVLFEFVGEFDLAINKFWYFIFSKFSVQLKKIYRLVKGKK